MAYVYKHIRLDTNQPFYIGIGNNIKRAYCKSRRSKHWINIANKHGYKVEILHENISWDEAKEKEKEYIKLYGRIDNNTGILVNFTDGGEGLLGYVFSQEQLQKKSDNVKGEKNPMFGMNGEKNHMYGKTHTEEARKKISEKLKGKKYNEDRIEQMRISFSGEKNPMFGKNHTEETKKIISEKNTGKTMSEESKKKISESHKGEKNYWFGKKIPQEFRDKMSLAQKGKKLGKEHHRSKPVYYLKNNEKIIYYSSYEAERATGIYRQSIGKCCNGKLSHAGGIIWKFLEKNNKNINKKDK